MLYSAGGRNFLFLNVPPVDRSPLTMGQGVASEVEEKADIAAWNSMVASMAAKLKGNYSDANVFTFDTNALFTEVLDNPDSFPQTSIYKNTTTYCVAYEE
jgi:phospholipase/lecithinase/hemolysin